MLQLFARMGLQAVPPLRHSPLSKLKKNRRNDKKEEKTDVNAPHGALGELCLSHSQSSAWGANISFVLYVFFFFF